MKITDIELISFTIVNSGSRTRWGYGEPGPEREVPHSCLRIATDDGQEGYSEQGWPGYFHTPRQDQIDDLVKPLLIGEENSRAVVRLRDLNQGSPTLSISYRGKW